MTTKLETALEKYAESHPAKSDADILAAVRAIIAAETAKCAKERDADLLDEAIDAELMLTYPGYDGIDVKCEELKRAVLGRISEAADDEKPVRRFIHARWLIPAAVILAALAATVTAAVTGMLKKPLEFNKEMEEMHNELEVGKTIHGDGWDMTKGDDLLIKNNIKTLDDLAEQIDTPRFLLPYGLVDKYQVKIEMVEDYITYKAVVISLILEDKTSSTFYFETRNNWNVELETERIGKFDINVGSYELNGEIRYCAAFQYEGCDYYIYGNTKEILIKIINSLEEIEK